MNRRTARGLRLCLRGCAALLALGCARPAAPLFPELDPALAWPPPPDEARIRYLGQISTSVDLGAGRSSWAGFLDVVFGEEEPEAFQAPRSAVVSADGRWLWVGDPGARCVHLVDLEERRLRRIDRAGEQPLLSPVGLALGPEGSVYVCDSEAVAIHRLAATDGALIETLTLPAELARPVALHWDPHGGELFVVDVSAHDVKVLAPDGALRRTIGRRGEGPGEFNYPCDVAPDGDLLWLADTGNSRVQALRRDGTFHSTFGRTGDSPGDMAMPKSLALDRDGHLYVLDSRFENVQIFDRSGQLLLFFGGEGSGPGEFWLPGDVFVDTHDRIWICDAYNRRVQVFAYVSK